MRIIILFILLTSTLRGQRPSNLDKYTFLQNVRIDSNQALVYYTNDNAYFIAYQKGVRDSAIKYVFEKQLLNIRGLMAITPNSIIVGALPIKKDEAGKETYYSVPHDKYLNVPTYTYIIKNVKTINISKNNFVVQIKVESGNMTNNFEIKYRAAKSPKVYKIFADLINHSRMTGIYFAGTEF